MIWQNPWAWAGVVFLALPVLIHLLGRGQAPHRVFPTLRFLPPSRSLPTRRRRVRDPLLLAVRLGVLASALIALAQPYIVTSKRRRDSARGIARAIIVDTSESMRRASSGADSARAIADRLARGAQTSIVIQSSAPRRAIAGALAWIARQQRRAELVIVSDFQTGTIDSSDLAPTPRGVGIHLGRVEAGPAPRETIVRSGAMEISARVTPATTGSTIEWTTRANSAVHSGLVVLAGEGDRSAVDAAQRAAATVGARLPADSNQRVAIVFHSSERYEQLLKNAGPPTARWMVDMVRRLRADSMLIGAAAGATPLVNADSEGRLVVARSDSEKAVIVAARGQVEGGDHLLLLPLVDASTLTATALIAATSRALADPTSPSEMEPTAVSDDILRSWQRDPDTQAPRATGDGVSDGRWSWVVALVLLGLETWTRRARREETASTVVHDRAA